MHSSFAKITFSSHHQLLLKSLNIPEIRESNLILGYRSRMEVLGCFLLRDELLDKSNHYGTVQKTMSLGARKIWLLQTDGRQMEGKNCGGADKKGERN